MRLTSPVAPAFVVLGESLGPAQLAGEALVLLAAHPRLRVAEMNAPAESSYSHYEKETS